jgi:hypothetical protein
LFTHEHAESERLQRICQPFNGAVASQLLRASLWDAVADHHLRHLCARELWQPSAVLLSVACAGAGSFKDNAFFFWECWEVFITPSRENCLH